MSHRYICWCHRARAVPASRRSAATSLSWAALPETHTFQSTLPQEGEVTPTSRLLSLLHTSQFFEALTVWRALLFPLVLNTCWVIKRPFQHHWFQLATLKWSSYPKCGSSTFQSFPLLPKGGHSLTKKSPRVTLQALERPIQTHFRILKAKIKDFHCKPFFSFKI